MPRQPRDGKDARQALSVRLPKDLVIRLRELGATDIIEQATIEYLKRTDTATIEIKQDLIDEAVTWVLAQEWPDILSDLSWGIDLSEGPLEDVEDDIRKQLDKFDLEDDEYDRLYDLYSDRALELAKAVLDKRLKVIRKTINKLYQDVALNK